MKRSHIIAMAVFLVLAGAVLTMSPRRTQQFQAAFLQFFSPFVRSGSALQRKISAFSEGLKTLQQLEDENRVLRVENKNLKATNQLLGDLAEENKRLRAALTYRDRSDFKLVPARILSRDAVSWWSTVKIDRGFEDGLESEMAVVTEDGLVGKITTVARDLSTVVLLADETCRVSALVEGTREQGILMGRRVPDNQSPKLVLRFLSKQAALQPGMRVVSSGVGGVFPPGLLLGAVEEFKAGNLDGMATVGPAVDLARIQDVFVVTRKP